MMVGLHIGKNNVPIFFNLHKTEWLGFGKENLNSNNMCDFLVEAWVSMPWAPLSLSVVGLKKHKMVLWAFKGSNHLRILTWPSVDW